MTPGQIAYEADVKFAALRERYSDLYGTEA